MATGLRDGVGHKDGDVKKQMISALHPELSAGQDKDFGSRDDP